MDAPDRPRTLDVGPANRTDPSRWTLRVSGLVEYELAFSVDELAHLGAITVRPDRVKCPEGRGTWNAAYSGVSLGEVLAMAKPIRAARYVSVRSGPYVTSFRLESLDRRSAILALSRDGQLLDHESGGPVRLIASQGACFDSVKWVEEVRLAEDGSAATAVSIVKARRGNGAAEA